MRDIPEPLLSHIRSGNTTLALCWQVTRRDGVFLRGTQHDRDITITTGDYAGTYLARAGITGSAIRTNSDLSVDNLEVTGALPTDLALLDLSAADIEAGLLDVAEAVTFLVNFNDPDTGQVVLRQGNLGNIQRTAEGQYRTELRGKFQRLTQIPIRTYGVACDADLGDSRCTVDLVPFTASGTVDLVGSRRRFDATVTPAQPEHAVEGYFIQGLLTFTTGENAGYSREIKFDAAAGYFGEMELLEPFPREIQVGDEFTMTPGCAKSKAVCISKFDNILNFRGHGVFVPGMTEVLKVGGQ